MGAAWREVKDGPAFDRVLDMVRGVKALGLEACCTLGMLTDDQARRLKEAGLDAYNHNLDTSRENYRSIITTRTYDDRLRTLRAVREAGITVCTGGIIGMGESIDDRCRMLVELASLDPHPESVPINALVRVEGTPLAALAAHRSPRSGAHDRLRAHPDAEGDGAPLGGPHRDPARGAAALPLRGRQLHLLRRKAPHHAEPRRKTRTSSLLREAGLTRCASCATRAARPELGRCARPNSGVRAHRRDRRAR